MKKVSVIISCFNASKWVRHAYNSIKNQTMDMSDIECIFLDDASTDNGATWNELLNIENDCPESVMVIHLDVNMRQGGARNIGMKYMTGKYMMFLDADDLYRPETCQELYDLASENNLDVIQFQHDHVWRSMDDVSIPEREPEEEGVICDLDERPDIRRTFLTGYLGGFGCTNKFYNAQFIRRVGATFAEHVVYEEPKFVFPLFLEMNKFMLKETKYYIYRHRPGSTMTSELGIRLLDHPVSQYQLMEFLLTKPDIYREYKEEIDYHFAYSYIFETLRFYIANNGDLPLGFFEDMSAKFISIMPDADNNKYLIDPEYIYVKQAVDGCRRKFSSQQELHSFATDIVNCFNKVYYGQT